MEIIRGIKLGTAKAAIKYENRLDLVLIKAESGSHIAGVFTQNAFAAAPVQLCRQKLKNIHQHPAGADIYLLINTGNANAGTGQQGYQDAVDCCQAVSDRTSVSSDCVFPFSTGVIGEKLAADKIINHIDDCLNNLSEDNWNTAAEAILTTDTRPKISSRSLNIQNTEINICGISKGSGMIRPDMATMLAFVATDLEINQSALQAILNRVNAISFNRISVDGDTSTNDACILLATGKSGINYSELSEAEQQQFEKSLSEVFIDLAKAIVVDGEGATKLINIQVNQGRNIQECLDTAYSIAHSPLVKTAFFASDPNWGRILAAVGRSGLNDFEIDKVEIFLDNLCIVKNGGKDESYTEVNGQEIMNQKEITIKVNLGRGQASEQIWTCDFSYDYVKINAEYRT